MKFRFSLELVLMELQVKKGKKTLSIPPPFAKSALKERAIHQLRDLRLEFVSKFPLGPLWSSSQYFIGNWSKLRAIMGKICTKIE